MLKDSHNDATHTGKAETYSYGKVLQRSWGLARKWARAGDGKAVITWLAHICRDSDTYNSTHTHALLRQSPDALSGSYGFRGALESIAS